MNMKDKLYGMYKMFQKWISLEGYYLLKRIRAKYYVIYREEGGAGFFSNYMCVLGHIVFARKLGYIPIIDMKNYSTLYSEDIPVEGVDNAWNYYFQNIDNTSLEAVYQSGRYVLCNGKYMGKYSDKYVMPKWRFPTMRTIAFYTPFIESDMRLRDDLKNEFETAWSSRVGKKDVVLGIHIRGTDMKNRLGHPTPASTQKYLDKTYDLLERYPEITKIFLATDENNIKEIYENKFQDSKYKLFMNEAFRLWDHGEKKRTGVHETKLENPRKYHKYLMGKEVLQDAWFLKQCDYLLCGHDNVANVVILWNQNRYKELVCLDPVEDDQSGHENSLQRK